MNSSTKASGGEQRVQTSTFNRLKDLFKKNKVEEVKKDARVSSPSAAPKDTI